MKRRQYVGLVAAGAIGASAGCMETLEDVVETVDDMAEEPDASGEVHGSSKSFSVDAEEGHTINVRTTVRNEGSGGRFGIAVYDPNGDQIDSTRVRTNTDSNWETFTAPQTGTHRVSVGTGNDRRMRIRVSISTSDPDDTLL